MTHTTRPAWPSPLAGRTAMKPGVAIVCGVHHVQLSFPARAQAAMERFYGEVLGLSALTVAGRPGLSFLAGGQRIDLVPYKGQSGGTERAAGNLVHLALTVSDVDALRQQLLRSEEHTSELQSPCNLVCRLLLEKKKKPK